MCEGERRAGVGTGAVEGSLGEERNESVKSKDMCLNDPHDDFSASYTVQDGDSAND